MKKKCKHCKLDRTSLLAPDAPLQSHSSDDDGTVSIDSTDDDEEENHVDCNDSQITPYNRGKSHGSTSVTDPLVFMIPFRPYMPAIPRTLTFSTAANNYHNNNISIQSPLPVNVNVNEEIIGESDRMHVNTAVSLSASSLANRCPHSKNSSMCIKCLCRT